MILYGQVQRQDKGGAEDRARTFPSAKMAVACGHVHGMAEWRSCEISYFNPSSPQNKFLQPLVREIFLSSVPHLKLSKIFSSRLWQQSSSQGFHLLQTMAPNLCHFRSPHLTANPLYRSPGCHHFSNPNVIIYMYINIDIIHTKEIRDFWHLNNPRSLFSQHRNIPVSNLICNLVDPNCMEVIWRTRLVHINHSRKASRSKLERDQENMACPQPDLWTSYAVLS